jgi:NAD(P)-dependent dehydrogenase (short-subunit alcohol dehydrogenase family)
LEENSLRLANKSVVITGASSGMGYEMVRLFVQEGANVVAVARREGRLRELEESLKDGPGKAEIYVGDVSLRETNDSMIDFAVKTFGKLDVLVNNAGITDDMSPITEVKDEDYHRIMTLNVYCPRCAMRKAVTVFLEQGNGGSIINIASIGAKRPIAGPVYCASKGALRVMSDNVAYMYAPNRIRANVLAPGGIRTEIATGMEFNAFGRERVSKLMASFNGLGAVADVAKAALFFASDDSAYVNGVCVAVDNAWQVGT